MGRGNIVRYNRNLGKYVNKVIKSKQEKKIIDEYFANQIPDTGTVNDLGQLRYIRKGDSLIERQGDSIDIVSVSVRGFVRFPKPGQLQPETDYYVRVIIFQWMDYSFTFSPFMSDIISQYDQAAPTGTISHLSFYNKENSGKYKILKDKVFSINFYSGGILKPFLWRFTNLPIKTIPYNLVDGGPDFYPTTGDIYISFITNINETVNEAPLIEWTSRTVFTDS